MTDYKAEQARIRNKVEKIFMVYNPSGWDLGHFNKHVDEIEYLIQSETTKAISATWNYTGEGYNGEYDGLTHNGGKRYTDEEVEAKVLKDVLARLQAEAAKQ